MGVATKAQEGSCVTRGWTHARLDEIGDINPRFSAEGVSEETEVTFLPMKSVEEHSGQIDVSESKPISAVRKGYTPFRNGDVIFAKITPCMENGKVAVVEGLRNGLGFGSTEFHVVRPHDAVSRQFLFYFLVRDDFRRDAERNMTGTAGQRRVPTRYLQEAKIQLPPITEQNRIVEKIEELFTKLDAGVRSLQQARAQLKSYRRSVLKAAVEGELSREWREAHKDEVEPASELLERILQERREKFAGKKYKEPISPDTSELRSPPDGWEWASADLLTTVITDGEHITPERSASGVPLLSARNVQNGWLSFEKVDYISEYVYETLTRRLLIMPGDVLMSCSGTVGRSCVAPENSRFALVRSVAVLKPLAEMGRFLSYSLRSSLLQEQIHAKKTQTAQANIFQGKIRTLVFALPPLEEQRFIVEEVERRLSVVDKLEATVEASLKQANGLRQSILKRAFSGELVPQDPDDEPASTLLERIRKEREAAKQKKPDRRRRGKTGPTEREHAEQGGLF